MPDTTILIYEDAVHGMVLSKILQSLGVEESGLKHFPKRGKSYIDKNIQRYAGIAHERIVILRDLDDDSPCAPELKAALLSGSRPGRYFVFRIAVREAEAWLLADTRAAEDFFKLKRNVLARIVPERMSRPKEEMLELIAAGRLSARQKARFYKRASDGGVHQESSYNDALSEYIRDFWSCERARRNAPSLDRAIKAIADSFGDFSAGA